MTTATSLLKAGQLNAAIEATAQAVKVNPTDLSQRTLLCDLLCFSGDPMIRLWCQNLKADKKTEYLVNGHQKAEQGSDAQYTATSIPS